MTSIKKSSKKQHDFNEMEKVSLKIFKQETGKDLYSGKLKKFFEGETPRKIKNVVKFIIINILFLSAFIVSNKGTINIFAKVEEAVKAKKDIDPSLGLFARVLKEYTGVLNTLSRLDLLIHIFSVLAIFVQVIPFIVTNAYKFKNERLLPSINQLAKNSRDIENIYIKQYEKIQKKEEKDIKEAEALDKRIKSNKFTEDLRDLYNKM